MIKCKNISKSYNGKDILNNISFSINEKEKIGIIGHNGVGKTTLLRIISGEEEPDTGEILREENILIGYFKQEFTIHEENYDIESFIKKYIGIDVLEARLHELENEMDDDPNKIDEYCNIQNEYIRLDGYNIPYKLDKVLFGLGLNQEIKSKKIKELSGGQKEKVMLASVLLKGTDLLILDEPTNNLDLKSIEWLEKYLKEIQCPIMIVSHDRKFLDDVVTKIIEIDYFTRNLIEYPGNYSEYKKFKQQQEESELKRYQEQQEKIGDLKKSINQKKEWAQKGNKQEVSDKDKYTRGYLRDRSQTLASNAKKIENQISQMEIMDRPKIKNKLHIEITNSKKEGNTDIIAKDLVSGYDNGFKTEPINLHIKYGERIVITGDNGSGKSTFLKTLIGEQKQIEGQTYIGNGIKIGYISQDTKEQNNESIEEYVKNSLKNQKIDDSSIIYTVLSQFNFDYEERTKKYSILSPGERTRLKLAIFSLEDINTLILDEPTNHLDIEALEAIEEVLKDFNGTVIAISHDRQFIKNIYPNKILEFTKGKIQEIYHREDNDYNFR